MDGRKEQRVSGNGKKMREMKGKRKKGNKKLILALNKFIVQWQLLSQNMNKMLRRSSLRIYFKEATKTESCIWTHDSKSSLRNTWQNIITL